MSKAANRFAHGPGLPDGRFLCQRILKNRDQQPPLSAFAYQRRKLPLTEEAESMERAGAFHIQYFFIVAVIMVPQIHAADDYGVRLQPFGHIEWGRIILFSSPILSPLSIYKT